MNLFYYLRSLRFIALTGCLLPAFSQAVSDRLSSGSLNGGIGLNQTRVIFLSTDKAKLLTVSNTSHRRWLVQSRVKQSSSVSLTAPFIVTPPLFVLQPDSRQMLRIISAAEGLPADRESLFTLSLLAIPAAEARSTVPDTLGKLSMGIQFTLKLFYRPVGIAAGIDASGCRLQLTSTSGGIKIANPTPYFQTLGQLTFNGKPVNLLTQPSVLPPFGSQMFQAQRGSTVQAVWKTVTDYGGLSAACQQSVQIRD